MSSLVGNPVSADEGDALHRRLVEGDVTASSDLARRFLDTLIAWLVKQNSAGIPEELCSEAAEDALLSLAKSPRSFDPARGISLTAYLRMSAQGDLKNILRRENRHRQQIRLQDVELSPAAGKYLQVVDDPSRQMEANEEGERAVRKMAPAREGLSEGESQALDLILQGERKTAEFARALGIAHLPANEQRTQVKRVKDKLKKRIQRETSGNVDAP